MLKYAGFWDFFRSKPKMDPKNRFNDKRANSLRLLVASQLGLQNNEVHDTDTWDSLGADELDRIEVAMDLERMYGKEVPDSFIDANTIGDSIMTLRTKPGRA